MNREASCVFVMGTEVIESKVEGLGSPLGSNTARKPSGIRPLGPKKPKNKSPWSLKVRVWGLGFRVQGSGFWV